MAKKEKQPPTLEQFEKKNAAPPTPGARTVKIKVIRPIEIDKKIFSPNAEVMVTEEEAKEYCDKTFAAYHPFHGYMPHTEGLQDEGVHNPLSRKQIVRAVRL